MNKFIEYALPTNSEHWTSESDEVPQRFFEIVEEKLTYFVETHLVPGVNFSVKLVPETMSANNRSKSSFSEDYERDILESIDHWLSSRWPDWLESCSQKEG